MKNPQYYKKLLEEERQQLEEELKSVGRKNPGNPNDWEATPADDENIDTEDENSLADKFEDFEERSAVEIELESRLIQVKSALVKLEKGTYGKCRVCGGEIEEARLEANTSAETCKAHLNN